LAVSTTKSMLKTGALNKEAIAFPEHNSAPTRSGKTRAKTNISQFMLILSSEKKHALLSRMRRRNAIRHSHQTLHLQKLRLISNATGTLGTARKTKTQNGNRRRRKTKTQKRIPKMVAKQEKITFLEG